MIPRDLEATLRRRAAQNPVVTLTGPRQSGKTTLCRAAFPDKRYVNLERPDVRESALADPRQFLASLGDGAVLDEVQRVPELFSYLQVLVDEDPRPGAWILTSSQNLGLLASVSQSLAGRTALLNLLPLGWNEVERFEQPPADLWTAVFTGGYPRIHDQDVEPDEWLADYVRTYVERDVRQLLQVGDLGRFQDFVRHCAARSGQLLNLSALGGDCGVSHHTARSWLGVLEASCLAFRLPPLHRNLRKRLTRSRKLYLADTGLLCWLLGIREVQQLVRHPLRGAVFETWVVCEIVKRRTHAGLTTDPAGDLRFYRDQSGFEIDVVLEQPGRLLLGECKSGMTVAGDALAGLQRMEALLRERDPEQAEVALRLLYGGEQAYRREGVDVVPWREVATAEWGV